jgi:ABC-type antimicrobial peptide transport system permease subunit
MKLVGSMGAVGLLLAIAGLYGLVAYNVSRRTREIGIRIALGAASSDVLRLVMGKGLVLLVGIGAAIGLAMGFAVEQLMNSMLFNAGGVDTLAYVIVVPSLFLATMLAAYVPAHRATRIAPTQALRYEEQLIPERQIRCAQFPKHAGITLRYLPFRSSAFVPTISLWTPTISPSFSVLQKR